MEVVFVCTGNTCRSPFAEGYFNSLKLKGVHAVSRGLSTDGLPASDNSRQTASEYGFDISSHRSALFSKKDFDADYIFTVSDRIRDFLIANGADKNKVFTLGNGIADPYGGNIDVYRSALGQIADEIDNLVFEGFFDQIEIVNMKSEHIPFIVKTEQETFSLPWSEKSIREYLKRPGENNLNDIFVASKNGQPLGYIALFHCLDEGNITRLAVGEEYRNAGVATKLIDKVFSYARKTKLSFVTLEVRTSNQKAVSLYKKFGFEVEGQRKNFYVNPTEDALIMTRRF